MPRPPRVDVGDMVYHVINRANKRVTIFQSEGDYKIFKELLEDIVLIRGMRIIAYCIMPNHWHLVLHPREDGHLGDTMRWLTTTHARRWLSVHKEIEGGHVYQGRYKSFPVETNKYLLHLIKYVERNPLRAKLVTRAEDWKHSSLRDRQSGKHSWLSDDILSLPEKYLSWVNEQDENIETIRNSVNKGKPFGGDEWTLNTIEKFKLESTVNGKGRPKKY
jgi:putative transposase